MKPHYEVKPNALGKGTAAFGVFDRRRKVFVEIKNFGYSVPRPVAELAILFLNKPSDRKES